MSSVTVTVVGPRASALLALPSDRPLQEVLPTVVEQVGPPLAGRAVDPTAWGLGLPGSAPWPPTSSLASVGIGDGAVVQLVDLSVPTAPSPLSLAARTHALLPPRLSNGERRRLARKAFLSPEPDPTANAPRIVPPTWPAQSDALPAPTAATFTAHGPTSRRARYRLAYRSTDVIEQLNRAIVAPRLRRNVTIAVVSPKGGVGKTTMTSILGTTLALIRRDRVVAVDTNPDFGSLGRVLTPNHEIYVDDILRVVDDPALSATALDAQLGRGPHGLMVLPAPTDPSRMERLDEAAYAKVIGRLQLHAGVVVLDCGTGLQDPAARAAISAADQLVLVTDAEPATASLVAEAGWLLSATGRSLFLVVNRLPARGSRLDIDALGSYLPSASGLVVVPDEPAAAAQMAGGKFTWTEAPYSWQLAGRELAAGLFADLGRLGLTA